MGSAHTALFNWLFARHHRGTLVLRIEDTDQSRSEQEHVQALCQTLKALGLDWDEGPEVGGPHAPYHQTGRIDSHRRAFERLRASGAVYPCYCTPAELSERREEARRSGLPPRYDRHCLRLTAQETEKLEASGRRPAWRLKVPEDGDTVVHDAIKGEVVFANATLDDFIVMRSDGTPIYNFAVVVDDLEMEITHVLRADEHLANTPKQLLIYRALGAEPPVFGHLPMILAADRSKLSKRHGAVAVEEFLEIGVLPEAILNYCALLGWSPPGGQELLTVAEMVDLFNLDGVNKAAAVYDVEKLKWMNGQHLRRLSPDEVVTRARPWLDQAGLGQPATGPALSSVVELVLERVQTLAELPSAIAYFYAPPERYDPDGASKHFTPESADRLRLAAERLGALPDDACDAERSERVYRALAEELAVKAATLIHPTRLALTGRTVGPSLFHIIGLLGRDETVTRLRTAVARITTPEIAHGG